MEQYELIIKTDDLDDVGGNLAGESKTTKDTGNLASMSNSASKAVTAMATTMVTSFMVGKVGETTRDSLIQRKIDAGMSVATTAVAFAVHPLLGVASLGMKMLGLAQQSYEYNFKANQERNRLEILNERAGNMNRSR